MFRLHLVKRETIKMNVPILNQCHSHAPSPRRRSPVAGRHSSLNRFRRPPLPNRFSAVLDVRHMELFLTEEYQKGSWEYKLIGSHDIRKHSDSASGGIFDIKYLKSSFTAELFNLKSWVGGPNDSQPKAMVTYHAVAINTKMILRCLLHETGKSWYESSPNSKRSAWNI